MLVSSDRDKSPSKVKVYNHMPLQGATLHWHGILQQLGTYSFLNEASVFLNLQLNSRVG